jgi:hypothetical protein
MKTEPLPNPPPSRPLYTLLEWVTAVVLMLVLAVLVWMPVAEYLPRAWRFISLEVEILCVLGLLTAALSFVSVLALLPTRNRPDA